MLKTGEYVMYSWYGACKVDGVKEEVLDSISKQYYILKPVNDEKATVMIPISNVQVRPVLSKEEAIGLLDSVNEVSVDWIDNSRLRNTRYLQILKDKDSRQLLAMLRLLLKKREELTDSGRKFSMQDTQILELTSNYLISELTVALDMERDELEEKLMAE